MAHYDYEREKEYTQKRVSDMVISSNKRIGVCFVLIAIFLLVSSMDYEDQVVNDQLAPTQQEISLQKAYIECLRLVETGELPKGFNCE